jgi:hypothetical protein
MSSLEPASGTKGEAMPWVKALCPDGTAKTFDECLACERECFDLEVREALFERERNWQAIEHTGDRISVTALLGCMRSTYLERKTEYAATPESKWYSLRGELIHRLVERPDFDNPYLRRSEIRLYANLNGCKISGQLDNYKLRFLNMGILKDWKSVGDNALHYVIMEGAKEDHIWQTNVYAWLARQNGYRVDRIEVAYLSLMAVVKTGRTAALSEFLVNPPSRSGKRRNMIGRPRLVKEYPSGKKRWESRYMVPPVPLYNDETVIEFMTPRVKYLSAAFKAGIMPPMADEEVRKWKCEGYCNVRSECESEEARYGRPWTMPEQAA